MNKQEPTAEDIKKDTELLSAELADEIETDNKAYMVGVEEAKKMLIAIKKAKKIFEKEPDNPTVDDIIEQCFDCIKTHNNYLMGALNLPLLRELYFSEDTKDETKNIEQKAELINHVLKILTVAAL